MRRGGGDGEQLGCEVWGGHCEWIWIGGEMGWDGMGGMWTSGGLGIAGQDNLATMTTYPAIVVA